MVVIAVDGRKLWFTCREVNVERQKFRVPAVKPTTANDGLKDPDTRLNPPSNNRMRAYAKGNKHQIFLPPELEYLEERIT